MQNKLPPAASAMPVKDVGSTSPASVLERIPEDVDIEAALPDPAADPRALYRRIRMEARDREWASRAETGVKGALAAIPNITQGALRVSCASTLCEVRGSVQEGATSDNANTAMQALQGGELRRSLDTLGLDLQSAAFGGGGRGMPFTLYLRRL